MLDRLNQEIKVGSIIAYGHALGRCAGLRIGKVLKLKQTEIGKKRGWSREKHQWIETNELEYSYAITVMGVDDDWDFDEPKLCVRKGTLQFPERIVVLNQSTVPEKYLNLLKDVQ